MPKKKMHKLLNRSWKKLILMKRIYQDPSLPKGIKFIPGLIIAHLLSPIDIIPDFIPVLGYLDDLIVVGFLLWLFFRLVPKDLALRHSIALENEGVPKFDLRELARRNSDR
jgi:uncharacterized membrane protein YkvA (DUF1232 family)